MSFLLLAFTYLRSSYSLVLVLCSRMLVNIFIACCSLMLLIKYQDGHPACENTTPVISRG